MDQLKSKHTNEGMGAEVDAQKEAELKIIAKSIVDEIHAQGHEFWIDPESHYRDHMQRTEWVTEDYDDLRSLIRTWKMTRSLIGKTLIGLAIVGTGALIILGLAHK